MHHEAGRFVDDEQGAVLEDDIHGQRFGSDPVIGRQLGLDSHPFAAKHLVAALWVAAIDHHVASLDPALQPRARILRQSLRQGLVEAQARQLGAQIQLVGTELHAGGGGRKSSRRHSRRIAPGFGYTPWNYSARRQRKALN